MHSPTACCLTHKTHIIPIPIPPPPPPPHSPHLPPINNGALALQQNKQQKQLQLPKMRNSWAAAAAAAAALVAMALALALPMVEASPNTGWVWQVCSPDKIPPGNPYFDTVGTALADILQNTARTDVGSGYFYRIAKTSSPFPINNNYNNAGPAGVAYGGYGPGPGSGSGSVYGNAGNNNDAGAGAMSNLATVYAAARCSDHLPPPDCRDCLRVITDSIWSACSNSVSAQLKLVDCFVRYDHYNFDD